MKSVLPFEITDIDSRLPGGGLTLGALHEIAGGGDAAAAAFFAAGITAHIGGKVPWGITRPRVS